MKSMMIAASAAVLALAAPALAQAETSWYGSLGYASVDIDPVKLGAIQGRLGAQLNDHFAIEGEAAFGVADDTIGPFTVELNNEVAAFLVGKVPVGEKLDVFARLGYSSTEIDISGTSGSGDGVAYGVGVEGFFTEKDGVRLDWTRHDADGTDADVWALAYVRKF